MVDYPRIIAGISAGTGALILIWKGYIYEGTLILSTMLGFFIGEANGRRTA